ncbi:MAG: FAD-binding domain-containing protein [bacterium]
MIPDVKTREEIFRYIDTIDSDMYGRTRNYVSGAVTYLSPYISRGVITIPEVIKHLRAVNKITARSEKFLQQLIWREFWQQQWFCQVDIDHAVYDTSHLQSSHMSEAIVNGQTGITQLDAGIKRLEKEGYMHNHMRLYVASLCCNIAKSHWLEPAKWLYYYLLDGDWASNALSWQWVAGVTRQRQYFMNQDNINKYTKTVQKDTFLDQPYDVLVTQAVPNVLMKYQPLALKTSLERIQSDPITPSNEIALYTSYTLDPTWLMDQSIQRVLLLEPSHFDQYPVSQQVLDFILKIAKTFIPSIKIWVAEFDHCLKHCPNSQIYYQEHPFTRHFKGHQTKRQFLVSCDKPYFQFFKYYKAVMKSLSPLTKRML